MHSFKPALVLPWSLTFPALSACPRQIDQLSGSLMDSTFRIPLRIFVSIYCLIMVMSLLPCVPIIWNNLLYFHFFFVLSCPFTVCLHGAVRVVIVMTYILKSDRAFPSLKPFSYFSLYLEWTQTTWHPGPTSSSFSPGPPNALTWILLILGCFSVLSVHVWLLIV